MPSNLKVTVNLLQNFLLLLDITEEQISLLANQIFTRDLTILALNYLYINEFFRASIKKVQYL